MIPFPGRERGGGINAFTLESESDDQVDFSHFVMLMRMSEILTKLSLLRKDSKLIVRKCHIVLEFVTF